ncbi:TAF15 isoform 1, partial [Pongo abelii]
SGGYGGDRSGGGYGGDRGGGYGGDRGGYGGKMGGRSSYSLKRPSTWDGACCTVAAVSLLDLTCHPSTPGSLVCAHVPHISDPVSFFPELQQFSDSPPAVVPP